MGDSHQRSPRSSGHGLGLLPGRGQDSCRICMRSPAEHHINQDYSDLRMASSFDQALTDVGLTEENPLRKVLHDYFAWSTTTTMSRYHRSAEDVPDGLPIQHWSWDGPVEGAGSEDS